MLALLPILADIPADDTGGSVVGLWFALCAIVVIVIVAAFVVSRRRRRARSSQ